MYTVTHRHNSSAITSRLSSNVISGESVKSLGVQAPQLSPEPLVRLRAHLANPAGGIIN